MLGAKRRSNPGPRALSLDCFATLAMTRGHGRYAVFSRPSRGVAAGTRLFICSPVAPVGRPHVDPSLGLRVDPAGQNPDARAPDTVRAVAVEQGQSGAAAVPGLVALVLDIASALRRGELGLDIVAALSMTAALAVGEALAAAIVALMYAGGKYLESFADRRARREMTALLARVPRTAVR